MQSNQTLQALNLAILNTFSLDLVLRIYDYLTPEEIFILIRITEGLGNKFSQNPARINAFWKNKYQRHFELEDHVKKMDDRSYRLQFLEASEDQYNIQKNKDSLYHWIFSLVKESDTKNFTALKTRILVAIKEREIIVCHANEEQENDSDAHIIKFPDCLDKSTPLYLIVLLHLMQRCDKAKKSPVYWAYQLDHKNILNYFYSVIQKIYTYIPRDKISEFEQEQSGRTLLSWALHCDQSDEIIFALLSQKNRFDERYTYHDDMLPIHLAVYLGRLAVVKKLNEGEKAVSINSISLNGITPLYLAVRNSHESIVEYLLNLPDIEVNQIVPGCPFVQLAAGIGNVKILQMLINAGADTLSPLEILNDNVQGIHVAVTENHEIIVKILIENNPRWLNTEDACHRTPLLAAVVTGKASIAKYLLSKPHISFENTCTVNKVTCNALHYSITEKNIEILNLLINAGANLSTPATIDSHVYYPIHLAAAGGFLEGIKLLVKHNAQLLYEIDAEGQTPLMIAKKRRHLEVVNFITQIHTAIEENRLADVKSLILDISRIINLKNLLGQTPLMVAAINGNVDIFGFLLVQSSVDLFLTDSRRNNVLHYAARYGMLEIVELLIEHSPELLNAVNSENETPLMLATIEGHCNIVNALLTKPGINLEIVKKVFNPNDEPGARAIHLAIIRNNPEMTHLLATAGADLTTTLGRNQSLPIHLAASLGHLDCVKVLVKHNPQLLSQLDWRGKTALFIAEISNQPHVTEFLSSFGSIHNAVKRNRLPVIQEALQHTPHLLNLKNENGQTPLILAISRGYIPIVNYLLAQKDIEIAALDIRYNGAIHYAVKLKQLNTIKLLMAKNPQLLFQHDGDGNTALMIAITNNETAIVEYLISQQMKLCAAHYAAQAGQLKYVITIIDNNPELLNQTDAYGQTPLIWAAAHGHVNIVNYLLEQMDINLHAVSQGEALDQPGLNFMINKNAPWNANWNGRSALHWAAVNGHAETVATLLKVGINPTFTVGETPQQPIHLAAQSGQVTVCETLLRHRPFSLNQVDAENQTPLLLAVVNGHVTLVKFLLSQENVDLNIVSQGKTALAFAAEKGDCAVVKAFLQKHGVRSTELDELSQSLIALFKYISKRTAEPEYKRCFTFFSREVHFGYSRSQKLEAASALVETILNNGDSTRLQPYHRILNNGELSLIYQQLQPQLRLNRRHI